MYFVYHCDDYENLGGIALAEFPTQAAATDFILSRLQSTAASYPRELAQYILIKGEVLTMTAQETTTAIKVTGDK